MIVWQTNKLSGVILKKRIELPESSLIFFGLQFKLGLVQIQLRHVQNCFVFANLQFLIWQTSSNVSTTEIFKYVFAQFSACTQQILHNTYVLNDLVHFNKCSCPFRFLSKLKAKPFNISLYKRKQIFHCLGHRKWSTLDLRL